MKENLYQAAKEYVEVIEKIERTKDPKRLQRLEEERTIVPPDAFRYRTIAFSLSIEHGDPMDYPMKFIYLAP